MVAVGAERSPKAFGVFGRFEALNYPFALRIGRCGFSARLFKRFVPSCAPVQELLYRRQRLPEVDSGELFYVLLEPHIERVL